MITTRSELDKKISTALDDVQEQAPPLVGSWVKLNRTLARRARDVVAVTASSVAKSARAIGRVADHGGRTVAGTARNAADRTISTTTTGARRVTGQTTAAVSKVAETAENELVDLAEQTIDRVDASAEASQTASLDQMTKDELYEKAQTLEIDGRSQMSKDQLVEAILSTDSALLPPR